RYERSRMRIRDHVLASNSRGGRSSTTPAATVSGPSRTGQPGCRPPPNSAISTGSPTLGEEAHLDLLPDADVGDVLVDHGQAVGFRERGQQVRAGRAQRLQQEV